MVGAGYEKKSPSMLHDVVNCKIQGTRPRGRPRTTWLKAWITDSGESSQRESVPGQTSLAKTVCKLKRNSYSNPVIDEQVNSERYWSEQ